MGNRPSKPNRSRKPSVSLDNLLNALASNGWGVCDSVISRDDTARFRRQLRYRHKQGTFRDAAVGRAASKTRVKAVRGDRLCWLDVSRSRGMERDWLGWIDAFQEQLNRALYLGLRRWEGHYAIYPSGAHYERHVDRFRDDDARVVSTVLYLNPRWQDDWGGQLRLFPDTGPPQMVPPAPGRLVCFMSDQLPHEVIRTEHERLSVVGWFRRD